MSPVRPCTNNNTIITSCCLLFLIESDKCRALWSRNEISSADLRPPFLLMRQCHMCRFVGSELVNSEDNIPDRAGVGVLLKLEDLAAELFPIRQVIRRNAPKPNIMLLKLQINNNCFVPLFGCFPNYQSHAHSTPMNNNLCLSLSTCTIRIAFSLLWRLQLSV